MKKLRCPLLLGSDTIAYCKVKTALGATAGKHLTALGGGHSFTETVLVNSLSVRGLECTFHCLYLIVVYS